MTWIVTPYLYSSAALAAWKASKGATHFYPMHENSTAGREDLIGTYDLTDGSGNTWTTVASGTPFSPEYVGGVEAYSTNTRWYTSGGALFDTQTDWTLSVWVYSTATTGIRMIVQPGATGGSYLFLLNRSDRGGIVVQMDSGSAGTKYFPTSGDMGVGLSGWHKIYLWRDYDTTDTVDLFGYSIDNGSATTATRATIGVVGSGLGTQSESSLGNRAALDLGWGTGNRLSHVTVWEGKVLSSTERSEDYLMETTGSPT